MSDARSYAAVTGAYWAFTLTDGALRMLVLLHFHRFGFTPLDLASLFLLYEAMGIVTNGAGGWIGARFGLRVTLYAGLAIQIGALLMLSAVDANWTLALSVGYVMSAQALSGCAKDLTKMSSKSAVKLVVNDEDQGVLFKWIALLTGSKNALKGLGFLLGGVLLSALGFEVSLWSMAAGLAVVLVLAVTSVRTDLGKAKSAIGKRELFSKSREVNILSAARMFLFASRDVWFVVGVPVYLYDTLAWSFDKVGGFMALWIIGYGCVQALVPRLLTGTRNSRAAARAATLWGFVLCALPALLASTLHLGETHPMTRWVVLGGLLVFGVIFAINSSLHSYLIVAYSDHDKVVLNVSFYYMANAFGRLIGTLLSGLTYQWAGLEGCLWVSAAMVFAAAIIAAALPGTQLGQLPAR
ncbi:MAG: putative MFS family arabinose efflux permease [Gammaproteobacteria bacterium]